MESKYKIRALIVFPLLLLVGLMIPVNSFSQPFPPTRTLTVNSVQALHFGTFCLNNILSSGGTVTVNFDGSRSSTGEITLLSAAPESQPAIFDLNICQGRTVVITYPETSTLAGTNGGFLILKIGPTERGPSGTSFQVNTDCSFITQIRVGGTLVVGNNSANPGGIYTGNFNIIFNQQ
jgi:hypothetical protein